MSNSKEPIQLFVPTYQIDSCLAEIRKCLEVGWTGLGFKTIEFENAWKAYTGLPSAHYLNSNTIGLQLALLILKENYKWKENDEVISTPLTFVSTNHAILHAGLKPVFADIDDSLCLDPQSIEARITSKTKAVMYVGLGGNPGRLKEVEDLCKRKKLILVLDAAHMAGSKYKGAHVGRDLSCTVFSFQAVKNLPTADSGMICFQDPKLDRRARVLSWLGINKDTFSRSGQNGNYKWYYDVEGLGFKAHGNSIIASIGIVQLKTLESENEYRRKLCEQYQNEFAGNPHIQLIKHDADTVSSRHLFQIRVPGHLRDPLIEQMNSENIFPGVHYRANTRYSMYSYALGTCPNAERADQELLSLPLHLKLTNNDVKRVSTTVLNFLSNSIMRNAA